MNNLLKSVFLLGLTQSVFLNATEPKKCIEQFSQIAWDPPAVEAKKSTPPKLRLDPTRFKTRFEENWSFTALGPGKNGIGFWKIGNYSHVAFEMVESLKTIKILGYSGSQKVSGQGTYLLTRLIEQFPGYKIEATMAFKNDVELMSAFRDIAKHRKETKSLDEQFINKRLSKVPFIKALRGPFDLKTTILDNGLPEFEIEYVAPFHYSDIDTGPLLNKGSGYFLEDRMDALLDRILVEPDSTFAHRKESVSFGIYENWLNDFPVEQKVIFKKP